MTAAQPHASDVAAARSEAIDRLRAALARTEAKIDAMEAEVSPCPCCPACGATARFGNAYLELGRKSDRQQAWLSVLLGKAGILSPESLRRAEERFARLSRVA